MTSFVGCQKEENNKKPGRFKNGSMALLPVIAVMVINNIFPGIPKQERRIAESIR